MEGQGKRWQLSVGQETAPSTAGSHSHMNSSNANLLADDHNLVQQQHSVMPVIAWASLAGLGRPISK